ncbi:MAG: nitrilase-related carbon-nitrogen hydrolase, partial [Pseudomonadota bacterium]
MAKTTRQKRAFHNPFAHGFVRIGAASPRVHLSRPEKNVEEIVAVAKEAHNGHYSLVTFPELSITGYTNDDLFLQATLLEATESAIASLARQTADLSPILLVGAPISVGGGLFNTAIVLHRGEILGVVPKSFLPNYREFYEKRYFLPASAARVDEINVAGQTVPFGNDLIFSATDVSDFTLHVEICEDV